MSSPSPPPPSPPPSRAPRVKTRRPKFDRKAPKVWDPEKARTIARYPKTPEKYEAMRVASSERMKRLNAEGKASRRGVPDGWAGRKAEVAAIREAARNEAKDIVAYMQKNDMVPAEDPRAEEALECVVSIIRSKAEGSREKMSAAKILLDFLKARPQTASKVTVETAEDFLAAIASKA